MPLIKILLHPEDFNEIKILSKRLLRDKILLISLVKCKSKIEAKKIKDYLLGIIYAKEGMAFQYKKYLLLSLNAQHDPADITKLSSFIWKDNQ
jgi:hypothetical protein